MTLSDLILPTIVISGTILISACIIAAGLVEVTKSIYRCAGEK